MNTLFWLQIMDVIAMILSLVAIFLLLFRAYGFFARRVVKILIYDMTRGSAYNKIEKSGIYRENSKYNSSLPYSEGALIHPLHSKIESIIEDENISIDEEENYARHLLFSYISERDSTINELSFIKKKGNDYKLVNFLAANLMSGHSSFNRRISNYLTKLSRDRFGYISHALLISLITSDRANRYANELSDLIFSILDSNGHQESALERSLRKTNLSVDRKLIDIDVTK